MAEIAIPLEERAAEGLLYKHKLVTPMVMDDLILREGIDAATRYLERRGKKIKSILNQKGILIIVGAVSFSLGIYCTMALMYFKNREAFSAIFGF